MAKVPTMKVFRFSFFLILLVIALPISSFSQKKLEVLFAYRPRAFENFREHIDQVSIVAPELYVNENGVPNFAMCTLKFLISP